MSRMADPDLFVRRVMGRLVDAALDKPQEKRDFDAMADETIDLKIVLSEARTDTKFATLMGEMRTEFAKINTRLDSLERSVTGIKPTIIITGIALAGVIIAALTYGQAGFGLGVSTREIIKATVAEYAQQHPAPKP